jgi:hypothetical protein
MPSWFRLQLVSTPAIAAAKISPLRSSFEVNDAGEKTLDSPEVDFSIHNVRSERSDRLSPHTRMNKENVFWLMDSEIEGPATGKCSPWIPVMGLSR